MIGKPFVTVRLIPSLGRKPKKHPLCWRLWSDWRVTRLCL